MKRTVIFINRMLMWATLAAVLVGAVIAYTSPARAEKAPLWKVVGEWDVRVDTSLNHGCFMLSGYGDKAVRVGFAGESPKLYLMLINVSLGSLAVGSKQAMAVKVDGHPAWTGQAMAFDMAGLPALAIRITAQVLAEFMRGHVVRIADADRMILHAKLNGTYAAGEELLACQKAMNASRPSAASDDSFTQGSY